MYHVLPHRSHLAASPSSRFPVLLVFTISPSRGQTNATTNPALFPLNCSWFKRCTCFSVILTLFDDGFLMPYVSICSGFTRVTKLTKPALGTTYSPDATVFMPIFMAERCVVVLVMFFFLLLFSEFSILWTIRIPHSVIEYSIATETGVLAYSG